MATEPEGMAQLVRSCENVYLALGSTERTVLPAEMEQRKKMRRSVIATRDLPAGTVLSAADLSAKRPGTGMAPETIAELIGKEITRDIEADTLILEADIKR